MESTLPTLPDISLATSAIFYLTIFVGLLLLGICLWYLRDAISPRKMIDRVRNRRGVDMLAGVVDEEKFLRSIRIQRIAQLVAIGFILIILFPILFSNLANLKSQSAKVESIMTQTRAQALWQRQQELAPASRAGLEVIQEKLAIAREAAATDAPDRQERLREAQEAIKEWSKDSQPYFENLDELGDTLKKLDQLQKAADTTEPKTNP